MDGIVKNGTPGVGRHGYGGKLGDSCHDNRPERTRLDEGTWDDGSTDTGGPAGGMFTKRMLLYGGRLGNEAPPPPLPSGAE